MTEIGNIVFQEGKSTVTMNNKQISFGEIKGRPVVIKQAVNPMYRDCWRPQAELKAYRQLRRTALKPFIPRPVDLVRNSMKKPIGLAVEARPGNLLTAYQAQKPLTAEMVDRLAAAVTVAYDSGRGVTLDYKMLGPDNLGFDGQGLWFCSCGLGQPDENYEATVRGQIDYLRENFCRKQAEPLQKA